MVDFILIIDQTKNVETEQDDFVYENNYIETESVIADFGGFPEIDSILNVQVFVESVMITYENCDNFGLRFKPYLEITIKDEKKTFLFEDDFNSKYREMTTENFESGYFKIDENKTKIFRVHDVYINDY